MSNATRQVFSYGSGMQGCLYDCGPHYTDDRSLQSKNNIIDFFVELFGDSISEKEEKDMRTNLLSNQIHYFANPAEAGADYCEFDNHEMSVSDYNLENS